LPEILECVALLCNPQSALDIAESIKIYLNDEVLIDVNSHKAYQRAMDEFSMPTHINRLCYHYQKPIRPSENMTTLSLKLRLRNKFRTSKENQITISEKAKVRGCEISIKGSNNQLIIEEGVNIRDSFIEIDGVGCRVKISKNCIIGEGCYLSARENGTTLTLGEDCMLSRHVKLMTSDGHNILRNRQRINAAKSITIGSHVWLADSVTVLKGVSIGDEVVVGINSTVTKSIDSNIIAAGNPAKVVASETTWQKKLTF